MIKIRNDQNFKGSIQQNFKPTREFRFES
jgi:hypothetical protein